MGGRKQYKASSNTSILFTGPEGNSVFDRKLIDFRSLNSNTVFSNIRFLILVLISFNCENVPHQQSELVLHDIFEPEYIHRFGYI